MLIEVLKSKIHRATVTEANLNYIGSITIDEDLMQASGILENEKVQVVNLNNGERFETYVIKGEKGSGIISLNGAAARLVQVGDKVIIMSYCLLTMDEYKIQTPKIIFVDEKNKITKFSDKEEHSKYIC
ncbi:MAG: aspartate 1-decarboxylase [Thermovenabulum sp.]|uniref:aspartate 1-decarboxylase n=1 Tax=Thermovenabulum sp. TaxID=3100335 RepID=UPI003C7E4610